MAGASFPSNSRQDNYFCFQSPKCVTYFSLVLLVGQQQQKPSSAREIVLSRLRRPITALFVLTHSASLRRSRAKYLSCARTRSRVGQLPSVQLGLLKSQRHVGLVSGEPARFEASLPGDPNAVVAREEKQQRRRRRRRCDPRARTSSGGGGGEM